jgi:2-hydroxychromene-2-carboxylate isomerase
VNRTLELCFDYLSPYAYLAWLGIGELCEPRGVELRLRPVLLAGLLQRWGQLGPAEIPPKRQFVARDAARIAARRGITLCMPAQHPFNPLPALRASLPEVAGGAQPRVVAAIFRAGWSEGADIGDPKLLARIFESAGLPGEELLAKAGTAEAKAALKRSTDEAIALGVFGVPTMIFGGELFWGNDQLESVAEVLDGRDRIDARALDALTDRPLDVVRRRRAPE